MSEDKSAGARGTASTDLCLDRFFWATLIWFLFFFLVVRFWAVRYIKLAMPSAFARTLIYRIVSYRIITRSSAITEEPHDALCQLKSCQKLHSCTKNHIWNGLKYVRYLEGQSYTLNITYYLVVYGNNDSVVHHFRYITTLTVWLHVTFISPPFSKTQLKLQATCGILFTCKHIVDNA